MELYYADGRKESINPYDYIEHFKGVRIRVIVGFNRSLPRTEELDEEDEGPRTREEAGISVVCNDRVILHNDTTFRTGWGTRGVPKFHNQFMAISGLISFLSNDADKLPVSTTKTGVDMESEVYDHALSVCASAVKLFTNFTNKWKGRVKETTKYFAKAKKEDAVFKINLAESNKARRVGSAHQFKPDLPLPRSQTTDRRISFARPLKQIETVSEFLFNEIRSPSEVGEECFDLTLKNAKEEA